MGEGGFNGLWPAHKFCIFLANSGTGMFLNWENLSPPEFKTFTQVLLSWSAVVVPPCHDMFILCTKSEPHESKQRIFCIWIKVIYIKCSKHWPYTVCAENVKSWCKSWVFPFIFQAYILPHTLNCMCVSLLKFHIWILEQF